MMPYQAGDENISQETVTSMNEEIMIEPSAIDIKGIAPNPVQGSSTLAFTLLREKKLSIDILDINGKTIAIIESQKLFNAGEYNVPFANSNLANGLYICRVVLDGKSISIPFSVVK